MRSTDPKAKLSRNGIFGKISYFCQSMVANEETLLHDVPRCQPDFLALPGSFRVALIGQKAN